MSRSINYSKELNKGQQEAVFSTEGPHLVIAGAGSGKTRVLVFRTAYLVEKGIPPENILLLTFTRRASQEMLARASMILDDRCQNVSGGTFHSFANANLRKYARHIGLSPGFTILDQADSEGAVGLVQKKMGLNKIDRRFPKKGALQTVISKSRNKCVDIATVLYDEYPHFMMWADVIQSIKDGYLRYKKDMMLLDYDDLLIKFRDLLEEQETVRQQLSEKFQYIMVDEYQDTNKIQAQIISLLCHEHKNIMVVGDDSQSIYSFRGANFKNIIDFPKTFPGARVIVLDQNYRSSQPILDLTNEVIRCANEKYEKALFTQNKGSHLPVFVDVLDENRQSKYIINAILNLRNEGVKLNEIAVLFRSGWHSNDLEVQLTSCGLTYAKYGGQKFIDAAHIKDALSYLRVIHNPWDQVSWLRVLTLLKGVGPGTAAKIVQEVIRQGIGAALDDKLTKKNTSIALLMKTLKEIDPAQEKPEEILNKCLGFYFPVLMDQYDDYDKRLNDLESLQRIASRYETLEQFLSDMAIDPPEKSIIEAGFYRQPEEGLVLSTIHSAKGLEWHTVFLLYCAEGYLPSYRSLENEEALEEERRLFYVAATRAKKNLYLLRPKIDRSFRGQSMGLQSSYTRVSRFLEEGRILSNFVSVEADYSYQTHLI